jgi:hypothetical protein
MEDMNLFVKCSCYGEGVWIIDSPEDKFLYLSFWKTGSHPDRLPWKDRLRAIWDLVWRGKVWADDIVMRYDEAAIMADFIKGVVEGEQR